MEHFINYIREKYDPTSIIVYGSYASGTNNSNSDFDALVISDTDVNLHDVSIFNNTQLDIFVYSKKHFEGKFSYDDFLTVFDGLIVLDKESIGAKLKEGITRYIGDIPPKSESEVSEEIAWCKKMLNRARRNDAEGKYRWHWLLVETLEIYCDIKRLFYFGPKKALHIMEENDAISFEIYTNALLNFEHSALESWIKHLEALTL